MPLLRKRLSLTSNGVPRSLALIEEDDKDDVYIRLNSGNQVGLGDQAAAILQHRFSIHPSLRSLKYSTLKCTMDLADGRISRTVALTEAVKSGQGFTILYVSRASEMSTPRYDFDLGDDEDVIQLGEVDFSKWALIHGIFVGNPDIAFPEEVEGIDVQGAERFIKIYSKHFQLVICYYFVLLPATPFARVISFQTYPHSGRYLEGFDPIACRIAFNDIAFAFIFDLIQTLINLTDDPQAKDGLRDQLNSIATPERLLAMSRIFSTPDPLNPGPA
jgi:hypothetical protein